MNTDAVKQALKTLIGNAKDALVDGLLQQSVAREIKHITTSLMTPPVSYYYLSIHVAEANEASRAHQFRTVNKPPRTALYQVVLHIADYAVMTLGESQLYEADQANFDILVDRISKLISDADWIGSYRLVRSADSAAGDRVIQRSNALQPWFDEAEQYHAMLVSQLRFQLAEEQTA